MTKDTLSREAWLAAGFRTLAKDGPAALQIKVLALALGATKGSFYWHFRDLADFKSAMLALWQDKVATEIIADVTQQTTPQDRFAALIQNAARPAPPEFGGRQIEPAMRAWALSDPAVAAQLRVIDSARLGFLRSVLADLGLTAPVLSDLLYAAYIGLDDLAARDLADIDAGLQQLQSLVLGLSAQAKAPQG